LGDSRLNNNYSAFASSFFSSLGASSVLASGAFSSTLGSTLASGASAFTSSLAGSSFFSLVASSVLPHSNSQTFVFHFSSKSLEAASRNLASEERGDCIEPTSLPSNVSLEGIAAITFVSSRVFNSHSKIKEDQVIFSSEIFFIKSFTFPKPATASSFEHTTQI
jgi:hypothetical protein